LAEDQGQTEFAAADWPRMITALLSVSREAWTIAG